MPDKILSIDISGIKDNHKGIVKRLLYSIFTAFFLATLIVSVPTTYAASASMYLSAPSTVTQGGIVTVSIYENSGATAVNAAGATLSYPASLLDFVSIGSSSAFNIAAASSGGGGSVLIDRGALPAVSGKQLVGTVRFKAKASVGVASINITRGEVRDAVNSADISGSKTGVAITLVAPAAKPKAAPPAPADKTAPTVTEVAVSEIGTNSAKLTWKTNEPSNSQVHYGLNTAYGLTAIDNNMVTTHSLVLNSPLIQPAMTYHFVIKSADPAGNTGASVDMTFKTKGASLVVTVIDKKKNPLVGATVTFGANSAVTDKNGKATLVDMPLGTQSGTITYKGKKTVVTANITGIDVNGEAPALTLTADAPNTQLAVFSVLALMILALGVLFVRTRQNPAWASVTQRVNSLLSKKNDYAGNNKVVVGGSPPPKNSSSLVPIQPPVVPTTSSQPNQPALVPVPPAAKPDPPQNNPIVIKPTQAPTTPDDPSSSASGEDKKL